MGYLLTREQADELNQVCESLGFKQRHIRVLGGGELMLIYAPEDPLPFVSVSRMNVYEEKGEVPILDRPKLKVHPREEANKKIKDLLDELSVYASQDAKLYQESI